MSTERSETNSERPEFVLRITDKDGKHLETTVTPDTFDKLDEGEYYQFMQYVGKGASHEAAELSRAQFKPVDPDRSPENARRCRVITAIASIAQWCMFKEDFEELEANGIKVDRGVLIRFAIAGEEIDRIRKQETKKNTKQRDG